MQTDRIWRGERRQSRSHRIYKQLLTRVDPSVSNTCTFYSLHIPVYEQGTPYIAWHQVFFLNLELKSWCNTFNKLVRQSGIEVAASSLLQCKESPSPLSFGRIAQPLRECFPRGGKRAIFSSLEVSSRWNSRNEVPSSLPMVWLLSSLRTVRRKSLAIIALGLPRLPSTFSFPLLFYSSHSSTHPLVVFFRDSVSVCVRVVHNERVTESKARQLRGWVRE